MNLDLGGLVVLVVDATRLDSSATRFESIFVVALVVMTLMASKTEFQFLAVLRGCLVALVVDGLKHIFVVVVVLLMLKTLILMETTTKLTELLEKR
ncbi:hypothetical protein L195_g047782 [Trifolium pratense]|uniref:Uncharacterized protein n=1 Tax=Trifolium pratense TaxID=57577 RepID=A0A2K3MLR5_TRIPR|nr:hypothetical protein L195_g047782 [Trifolium pratense]